MPDFSIVTISFNQAIYLEKCITSVLGQTGASFEYIVVDPGSTDGSREIISRYAGEIDTILLEPDNGPADGLNNGFQAATGRYLITINADDFLLPFALEKIFSLLSASSFPEILLCGGWLVNGRGEPRRRMFSSRYTPKGLVNHGSSMFQPGMIIRRELVEEVGGFNTDNHTCWDHELLVDLTIAGAKPVISTARVAAFRMHDTSISSGHYGPEMAERYARDLARIHDKMRPGKSHVPGRDLGLLARCEKYLRTPEIIPYILHDKILRHKITRAWARDIRSLSSSAHKQREVK
ncbi:glycosyltransferase [Alphaproteobacteria bacterium LSUCC0684]